MARKRWKKKRRKALEKRDETPESSNNKHYYMILIALVLVIIAGYYLVIPRSKTPSIDAEKIQGKFVLVENNAYTHEPGKVGMLEFFDFYCGHCYLLHKTLPNLQTKYGEKLEVTYVGFPLRPTSYLPLEAYELALEQGKGEEMKDVIYAAIHVDNKDVSDMETLRGFAEEAGLDIEEFEEGLRSRKKKSKINDNLALGNSYGLKGTPTVILDGQIMVTDNSQENLNTIIKSLLEDEV
ncbi:MAG: DsbA family protein [Candidatus Hydrothermarchaeales archaeon]